MISKSRKPCIIQGDQNFNLIDLDNKNISDFADVMFDHLFFSHINKPTRITRTSATCIDHIWSNIHDRNIFSGIITEKIADHMTTFQFSKYYFLLFFIFLTLKHLHDFFDVTFSSR